MGLTKVTTKLTALEKPGKSYEVIFGCVGFRKYLFGKGLKFFKKLDFCFYPSAEMIEIYAYKGMT